MVPAGKSWNLTLPSVSCVDLLGESLGEVLEMQAARP